ncbi:F-box family protein [Dorcoceras hygrometricum]|uniref:F-box family protein n=1 Tax=Dorcoceras hygrometricum TaxID=472368 RepID=A0A2Z7AN85_9LAMI|nr:F-box family protein [Dorcoceras hygrometricum]
MSLLDLQDVCIAIGSLATLDLPMVVDLIGIYVLKGTYCTLTMTNWFLQALLVIPRGSWGDVARRSTRCVLGKWVYLVTHVKSLFDLRDVCIVIGSLATLDLPMVVDPIGIYVLKGPYCILTTTDWSIGPVQAHHKSTYTRPRATWERLLHHKPYTLAAPSLSTTPLGRRPLRRPPPCAVCRGWTRSDHLDEEILFVVNSSSLLVQTDEGVVFLVVDRFRRTTAVNR